MYILNIPPTLHKIAAMHLPPQITPSIQLKALLGLWEPPSAYLNCGLNKRGATQKVHLSQGYQGIQKISAAKT